MKKKDKKDDFGVGAIVNNRFRKFRLSTGKTQKELAEVLGISQVNISHVENDPDRPASTYILVLLSEHFPNLNMNYLFGRTRKMYIDPFEESPKVKGEQFVESVDMIDQMQRQIIQLQEDKNFLKNIISNKTSREDDLPEHLNPFTPKSEPVYQERH